MKKKIRTTIIILLSVLCALLSFLTIYSFTANNMPYKASRILSISYTEPTYNYSKTEIRKKLNSITGVSWYIYRDKNLKSEISGQTNLIFRTIEVSPYLTQSEYIEVMCHELMHLKYHTRNERFTQYQTFVTLYNSEFKDVALNIAYNMQYGDYPYEYDCTAQIVDFLEKQPI